MKKILLISYFFPPIQSAESIMTFNAIKYLSTFGWEVIILSVKNPKKEKIDLSTLPPSFKNISIYRTFSIENIITRILAHFKILPDNKIGWMYFAVKEGKKILKNNNIDIIISRSTPITSHLIGEKLSSYSKLPWITCFSDPWIENPYIFYPNKIIKKINKKLEKKIISRTQNIVVTTKQIKQLFLKEYNIANKVTVIPNSYDPVEFSKKVSKKENNKFLMTYIGNFYGPRSPEPILKALRLLDKDIRENIRLKLVGSIGKFKYLLSKYKLEDVVEIISTVSRKNIFTYFLNSDILLLIDAPSNKENIFLPSKLLEYINIEKPIIAITSEGPSAEIIKSTKTGVVVSPEKIEEIKNVIQNYYNLYQSSKLKIEPNWSEIKKYSAENYAKKLNELIGKTIQQKEGN